MPAVIFDMDGLLIDSEPMWERAEKAFLASHQREFRHEVACQTTGMRLDELVTAMKKHYQFDGDDAALGAEIIHELKELYRARGIPLMPGAQQALEALYGKLPLGLASGSSLEVIEYVLETNHWAHFFQAVNSADEAQKGKPEPDVFLLNARRLGMDPAECVVLEDSVNGVRAAKAAGMKCIAVPLVARFQVSDFEGLADLVLPSLEKLSLAKVEDLFSG